MQEYFLTECSCCVFCHVRVKRSAITEVPQKVEAVSVPAQLDNACASGEGGKQDEDTFPSYQAQLDELRPLMNARLQEGTTW